MSALQRLRPEGRIKKAMRIVSKTKEKRLEAYYTRTFAWVLSLSLSLCVGRSSTVGEAEKKKKSQAKPVRWGGR